MRVAIVSGILFLSGVSALLFQTLWLRLSGLAFGNSVWSAALILSSFMAGLGLGSAIAASGALSRYRRLRLYAGLELVVGLFGCTLVFAIPMLGEWMRPVFQALWTHRLLLNVLRVVISFAILLIPTTAMGLTLPVLLDDPLLRDRDFGRSVGLLYGINTIGAMTGALVGEAYLIAAYGLLGTAVVAASLSSAAALIAWTLARSDTQFESLASPTKWLRTRVSKGLPWRLLLVSMGTGAVLLALEVIWLRFLRLYVASTCTAFSVMLAVVLAGIALGGLASTALPARAVARRQLLPALLLLASIATLVSYVMFPVPTVPVNLTAVDRVFYQQIAGLSLTLMFPTALLSGALLPNIVSCVEAEVPGRMNSTGLTILFNTAGAAVGPLLAAFVLLPHFGFQSALIACATAYAIMAVFATQKASWSFRTAESAATMLLGTILLLLLCVFPYRRDRKHLANARRPYEADGSVLLKTIEGTSDTLQLLRRSLYGQPYYDRLVTNSYSMSGTLPRSQRYMRLFAYLPVALRPESEDALLIGYGVGVTADALLRNAGLKHLDVVDISKEVLELADLYSGPDYSNPLRDRRVSSFVQDGRFFLQACPQQYDIITGEPPPLKSAGAVNLYTEQFFSLLHSRLKYGGVASFWLPIYQLTIEETKAILCAFHDVFPDSSVWATSDLEWVMVGMKPPFAQPNQEVARSLWANQQTGSDLVRIGIESPEQMSACFVMDGPEIARLTQGAEPLTDFYPKRLTDAQPDLKAAYDLGYRYLEHSAARERFDRSAFIREVWPNEWKHDLEPLFFFRETRFRSDMSGSNWLAELDLYLRESRLRNPVLAVQNSDEFRVLLAQRIANPLPPDARHDLVAAALATRDLPAAIKLLEGEETSGFTNTNDFFMLAYLYCLNGHVDQAEALASSRAGSIPRDWFVDWLWGELQAQFGFHPPR